MTTRAPTAGERPVRLAVVVASVRDGRFGPTVARWFAEQARRRDDVTVDLVDLVETGLGDDFGTRIAGADAVAVVTPEYNHSFPGPFKTAVDATGGAWRSRPVGFVAYGGLAGGLRAVEQLRVVFAELRAVTLRDTVSFHGARECFDDDGEARDPAAAQAADVLLDDLVRWADVLRPAVPAEAA